MVDHPTTSAQGKLAAARRAMVREIERSFSLHIPPSLVAAPSPRVLQAMEDVPRHLFVDVRDQADAYRNQPLPIGFGQTISQPFIVALMTELLQIDSEARVLEIGTGSGYQTAVLAHLARQVFTIEILEPLAARAELVLRNLELTNVSQRVGDGHGGWAEAAPFDGILVAAAPARVPDALVRQLRPGGRLVMPVGESAQQLIVVEMQSDQSTIVSEIIPVCFVPLTGDGA